MEVQDRGKIWAKIVAALIGGGATVLAAMLPLYCTSQRRLEQTTQTSTSEADALRQQLTKMEAQLRASEASRIDLEAKLRKSPRGIAPTGNVVIDHEFRFELTTCKLADSALECTFLITNLMGDRELSLGEGRIIDSAGNEYPANEFALGAQSGSFARMILPGAVPVRAAVKFPSVRPGTDRLEVLEIAGYNWPASGGRDHIQAKLTKINL